MDLVRVFRVAISEIPSENGPERRIRIFCSGELCATQFKPALLGSDISFCGKASAIDFPPAPGWFDFLPRRLFVFPLPPSSPPTSTLLLPSHPPSPLLWPTTVFPERANLSLPPRRRQRHQLKRKRSARPPPISSPPRKLVSKTSPPIPTPIGSLEDRWEYQL